MPMASQNIKVGDVYWEPKKATLTLFFAEMLILPIMIKMNRYIIYDHGFFDDSSAERFPVFFGVVLL